MLNLFNKPESRSVEQQRVTASNAKRDVDRQRGLVAELDLILHQTRERIAELRKEAAEIEAAIPARERRLHEAQERLRTNDERTAAVFDGEPLMRKEGVSRAIPDGNLRAAFGKYISTCLRQGRNQQAQIASDLFRATFDTAAFAAEKELEAAADREIVSAIAEFAKQPVNKDTKYETWASDAVRALSRMPLKKGKP